MATETRFCAACGKALIPGAVFCPSCGARVDQVPLAAAPTTPVAAGPIPVPVAPKKGTPYVRGCLVIVGLVFALGIVGSLTRNGLPTPTPAPAVAIGSGAAAAAVSSTAPAGAPPSSAAPTKPAATAAPSATPLAKVGQTVTGKNWAYQVTNVEKTKTLTWSEFGNKTDAKGVWVIPYLTLQNIAKQNYPINAHDFELRDDGGVKYTSSSQLEAFSFLRFKKLGALGEQFPPGVPVNTAVVFDVAPDAKGLKLWLVQESILVDLGQ